MPLIHRFNTFFSVYLFFYALIKSYPMKRITLIALAYVVSQFSDKAQIPNAGFEN